MYTSDLKKAIELSGKLELDEVVDLIDIAESWLGEHVDHRRKGKTPLGKIEPSPELGAALAEAGRLSRYERDLLIALCKLLRDSLSPIERRRINPETGLPIAEGTVVVKYIRRLVLVSLDPIDFDWKAFGPYLYLRVWATGGGLNKRKKRLKNYYIGRKERPRRAFANR
jgi:hypothetical protein